MIFKELKAGYKQVFAGLVTALLTAPIVLVFVAAVTFLVKLCYKVIMFVWG